MSAAARLWLVGVLALAACQRPPIDDPAEEAYHHAVELFAKASAETHDLTFRNPRFDEVLAALALVPQGDELRGKADALALQIRQARAAADRLDQESNGEVNELLADPEFSPVERDAPFPVKLKSLPKPAAAPASSANSGSSNDNWTPSYTQTQAKTFDSAKLPDWYRQAGYLGLGKRAGAPAGPNGATGVAEGEAAPAAAAANAAAPTQAGGAQSNPTPVQQDPGPPPVFGLPGPAGRAILGGR